MTGWGFPYAEWPQDLKDEYAYNPVAARKLLADAGYPNGFKTNIVADTASDFGTDAHRPVRFRTNRHRYGNPGDGVSRVGGFCLERP